MREIICLYDENGISAQFWALIGFDVYCYDIEHKNQRIKKFGFGRIIFMPWDARDALQNAAIIARHKGNCNLVLAYPPCDDLAVSGSRHFAAKLAKNPNYRKEAMNLVYTAVKIAV